MPKPTTGSSPLLLLHAFPLDARMWRSTADHYEKKRVVVTPSAAELVDVSAPSIAGMARAALEYLDDEAPDRAAVVVGVSMGGYLALELCKAAPERVAGLVLCSTKATADTQDQKLARDAMIDAVRAEGVAVGTASVVEKLLYRHDKKPRLKMQEMLDEQDPEVIIACLEAMRDRVDNAGLLPALAMPALVLQGEHDALAVPGAAQAMAEAMPNARFAPIPFAGHVPPMEGPNAFPSLLKAFLAENGL